MKNKTIFQKYFEENFSKSCDEKRDEYGSENSEIGKIIRNKKGKWMLYSHKGKVLGEHPSKKAAQDQERAIYANKSLDSHSEKFDRCVQDIKRKGGAKNAFAVCTNALGSEAYNKMIKMQDIAFDDMVIKSFDSAMEIYKDDVHTGKWRSCVASCLSQNPKGLCFAICQAKLGYKGSIKPENRDEAKKSQSDEYNLTDSEQRSLVNSMLGTIFSNSDISGHSSEGADRNNRESADRSERMKEVDAEYNGAVPKTLLARQDLEGDSSSTKTKSIINPDTFARASQLLDEVEDENYREKILLEEFGLTSGESRKILEMARDKICLHERGNGPLDIKNSVVERPIDQRNKPSKYYKTFKEALNNGRIN